MADDGLKCADAQFVVAWDWHGDGRIRDRLCIATWLPRRREAYPTETSTRVT